MDDIKRTHVYIVGAGFSKYAGLPLQSEFTEALLDEGEDDSLGSLVKSLRSFVNKVFDHRLSAKAKFWPNLEDLFTEIDLAANTGHHLGSRYAPSDLRTTRRLLLARMMLMLEKEFCKADTIKGADWVRLDKFFRELNVEASSFISINWDTVIERRIAELHEIYRFEYGCGAIAAKFPATDAHIGVRKFPQHSDFLPIIKIHGSVNWLYCDNCRQLYWFPASDAASVAMQLITQREGRNLQFDDTSNCAKWRCSACETVPLTTRIATFSYLKALDFPMFEKSWFSAERLLRQAKKWIFIGYSLPSADYEFKHLLKRVQLSRMVAPEFVVITGGEAKDTYSTYANYQRFFGRGIKREENVYEDGLTDEAIRAAHK